MIDLRQAIDHDREIWRWSRAECGMLAGHFADLCDLLQIDEPHAADLIRSTAWHSRAAKLAIEAGSMIVGRSAFVAGTLETQAVEIDCGIPAAPLWRLEPADRSGDLSQTVSRIGQLYRLHSHVHGSSWVDLLAASAERLGTAARWQETTCWGFMLAGSRIAGVFEEPADNDPDYWPDITV